MFRCECSKILPKLKSVMKSKNIRGSIRCSDRKDKKLVLTRENGVNVHFGQCGSTTYVEGASIQKRNAYRARHEQIFLKSGQRAIDVKYSPAYLSYHLLW